jgi:hypothetical protein
MVMMSLAVTREMVVISLGEQATAEQREFLGGGQFGQCRRNGFGDHHGAHRGRPVGVGVGHA